MKLTLPTILVAAGLALGLSGAAAAHGDAQVTGKIAEAFTGFAGSPENAESLVTGLRSGSEITLTGAGGTGTGGTDTSGRVATGKSTTMTFTSPTGPMGNGNVYASLALAKDQLASFGIDNPTPQQIAAALNGGAINAGEVGTIELQGVLQMRADGMGWGRIAQAQGTKLGWVMSELKSSNAGLFESVASTSAGTTQGSAVAVANGGRVAASKDSSGATGGSVVDAGGGNPGKSEGALSGSGRGIHNALGGNAASGHAYAYGRSESHGVIAASGASAGAAFASAGIVNAGSGGHGHSAAAAGLVNGSGGGYGHAVAAAASSNGLGTGVVSAAGGAGNGNAYGHGHGHGNRHAYGHGK